MIIHKKKKKKNSLVTKQHYNRSKVQVNNYRKQYCDVSCLKEPFAYPHNKNFKRSPLIKQQYEGLTQITLY